MRKNLIYTGKTKDVYELDNGHILLYFKDNMTGSGGIFDPGGNQIAFSQDGVGLAALKMSAYFFELLKKQGVETHFIKADIDKREMEVLPVTFFGKGLEFICRFRATGSFRRRFGDYIAEGAKLNKYVEITLKDDFRNDPFINQEALIELGILSQDEYQQLVDLTKKIAQLIYDELNKKHMELYDIKFEFGRTKQGEIVLIDELSGGNMRVFLGDKSMSPIDISNKLVG